MPAQKCLHQSLHCWSRWRRGGPRGTRHPLRRHPGAQNGRGLRRPADRRDGRRRAPRPGVRASHSQATPPLVPWQGRGTAPVLLGLASEDASASAFAYQAATGSSDGNGRGGRTAATATEKPPPLLSRLPTSKSLLPRPEADYYGSVPTRSPPASSPPGLRVRSSCDGDHSPPTPPGAAPPWPPAGRPSPHPVTPPCRALHVPPPQSGR